MTQEQKTKEWSCGDCYCCKKRAVKKEKKPEKKKDFFEKILGAGGV